MATKFITISIEIMHDQNLSQNQKFILAEIEQLSSLEKGCIASNQHFSELTGIAKVTVSRAINNLQEQGYIDIETEAGSRNHIRMITLVKMISPPSQNDKPPLSKRQETKENKTINKTINIYDAFILELKSKVRTPSKVTKTKEGRELFMNIEDKQQLVEDYVAHQDKAYQNKKSKFAQRITAFMEDYGSKTEQKVVKYVCY